MRAIRTVVIHMEIQHAHHRHRAVIQQGPVISLWQWIDLHRELGGTIFATRHLRFVLGHLHVGHRVGLTRVEVDADNRHGIRLALGIKPATGWPAKGLPSALPTTTRAESRIIASRTRRWGSTTALSVPATPTSSTTTISTTIVPAAEHHGHPAGSAASSASLPIVQTPLRIEGVRPEVHVGQGVHVIRTRRRHHARRRPVFVEHHQGQRGRINHDRGIAEVRQQSQGTLTIGHQRARRGVGHHHHGLEGGVKTQKLPTLHIVHKDGAVRERTQHVRAADGALRLRNGSGHVTHRYRGR